MDQFSNSQLEGVQIHPEELSELLSRLAATDVMFSSDASTIRDVSELTDANPQLIARILADIRGPDAFENLSKVVHEHEIRLDKIEKAASWPMASEARVTSFEQFNFEQFNDEYDEMLKVKRYDILTIGFVIIILLTLVLFVAFLFRWVFSS